MSVTCTCIACLYPFVCVFYDRNVTPALTALHYTTDNKRKRSVDAQPPCMSMRVLKRIVAVCDKVHRAYMACYHFIRNTLDTNRKRRSHDAPKHPMRN